MTLNEVFAHILHQIRTAPIDPDPFPHMVVKEIFPPAFYPSLLAAIPKPEQFVGAEYPGTGFGSGSRSQRASSGLAFPNLHQLPILGELQTFLRGDAFCRTLLERFSRPDGIPADKHRYYSDGEREFTSVFDLQVDRRGYEILPHPDVPSKIVTFLFYVTSDDSLQDFGTLFCRTKNGRPAARSAIAREAGALVERLAGAILGRQHRFWPWFERTKLGVEIGFGGSKNWYPWRMFDIASAAPALPNHFTAFAPNEHTYHAVRMNIPESSPGRTVIRGFIRSGSNMENFIRIKDTGTDPSGQAIQKMSGRIPLPRSSQ